MNDSRMPERIRRINGNRYTQSGYAGSALWPDLLAAAIVIGTCLAFLAIG